MKDQTQNPTINVVECFLYIPQQQTMYPKTCSVLGYIICCNQLHGDLVVGEAVWVTHYCCGGGALLLPSLETQVEDEDAEREQEEDVCDVERDVD